MNESFTQLVLLIPTVYRALLKGAVSGTDVRIHTTEETSSVNLTTPTA